MRRTAIEQENSRARTQLNLVFGALATIALLLVVTPKAEADQCTAVPPIDDTECEGVNNDIDGYKQCYADLYDNAVIPAFTFIAQCSHPRATAALRAALESASTVVTGTVRGALKAMEEGLSAPGPVGCMQQMNSIGAALAPVLAAEAAASDLPAHRRGYTYPQFVAFTSTLLAARENRAMCGDSLQEIKERLQLLQQLKTRHLDYCGVLEDSAKYEKISKISSLAQWTAVDPAIDFSGFFNFQISWNTHCSTFDINSSQTTHTPCVQGTVEYKNVLAMMDGSLAGWLAQHRDAIIAVTTATATAIALYAGYGASTAGPVGAVVGATIGAFISAFQYFSLRDQVEELEDLIDDKEDELRRAVEEHYITEAEFNTKRSELCAGWETVIDQRIQTMLGSFNAAAHIQKIDGYFELNDRLQTWYNDLLLWALQPGSGADGQPLLNDLAEQGLQAQRYDFEQQIFNARAMHELAVQKNILVNQKGKVSGTSCVNLTSAQKRNVRSTLRIGVHGFNLTCNALANALAVQTLPLAFASQPSTSDVRCEYRGLRGDIESIEVQDGAGSSATLVVRNRAGAQVAVVTDITSQTPRAGYSLPGLYCTSPSGSAFGTSATNELAAGTHLLTLINNTYGFDADDADELRLFLKDIDKDMRVKTVLCTRQLGAQVTIPTTADVCDIPVGF